MMQTRLDYINLDSVVLAGFSTAIEGTLQDPGANTSILGTIRATSSLSNNRVRYVCVRKSILPQHFSAFSAMTTIPSVTCLVYR